MKNLTLFTQIRTHLFIGKLTLAAILVVSVIGQVSAQAGDTTPPEISEFSFSPSVIDTTDSAQTVTVTIRITDPESKVSGASVFFKEPTRNNSIQVILRKENLISGDSNDGVYRATAVFPQYSRAGMWVITNIYASNTIGLVKTFSTSRLVARGFATQLQVISNNEDITSPEISDFSFTPTVIDTTNGSQNVTVTVRVKDAKSGVDFVSLIFRSSFNYENFIKLDSSNRISGDDKDGVYKGVITFSPRTPRGMYDVYVDAFDVIRNGTNLNPSQLAARGYPSQLQIKSTIAAIVTVAGRVTTANRRGISRALVRMTDSTGIVRTTYTNSFGYYSFANVEAGQTLIFDVRAKRYSFPQLTQVVSLNEESTMVNFTAY